LRGTRDSWQRVFKRWYFDALRAARINARALRRHAADDHLLILNLHSVSPRSNPYGPSLHPDLFEELLTWLQPRSRLGLLRDVGDAADRDPQRPRVVLSFDDGLRDFVDHAMPVLDSFGIRANQNVIGVSVQTGEPPWALGLVDLLGAAPFEAVRRINVPAFAGVLSQDDPYAKERFGAALTTHFKALRPSDRERALTALYEQLGDVIVEHPTRMMSVTDVAMAHDAGHEIGSHSYSHESMQYLDDSAFLADYQRSRDVLEQVGCEACTVYAFPNGSHRAGQASLLHAQGIRHVLLVGEQPSHPSANVHPRLTLRGDSASELRARAVNNPGVFS
jgi:peptidoglycan/xylan/chitin deacetylase (PgdA/CDA1 family)